METSEIGKKYGMLTIIEKTDKRQFTCIVYKCRCDCGNEVEVNINKLHTGHVKSCGCSRFKIKDLEGQKFGRLTVIELHARQNQKAYWRCRCDCGNEHIAATAYLTNGSVTSCGCKNRENRENLRNLDRGLVDGTMKAGINADRKVNKNSSSGITGVHWDKQRNKWVAQITFQRQNHPLGRFKSKEEAIRARKEAEEFYFGKYRNQAKK